MSTDVASIDVASSLKRDSAPSPSARSSSASTTSSVDYGSNRRARDVNIEIYKNLITAMIGPSGCGKSTFIRCLNRMNDLVPGVRSAADPLLRRGPLRG